MPIKVKPVEDIVNGRILEDLHPDAFRIFMSYIAPSVKVTPKGKGNEQNSPCGENSANSTEEGR